VSSAGSRLSAISWLTSDCAMTVAMQAAIGHSVAARRMRAPCPSA
jgi:hypothetical protein